MIKDEVRKSQVPADAKPTKDFTEQLIEPFAQLRSEVDRLFEGFPFRMPSMRLAHATTAWPPVEMSETKKSYKVTAELPGLDPADVEVTFEDGLLRIAGEKQQQREEEERGYRLSERSYGAFERLIKLPAAADPEKISAMFKKGVLTVSIAKSGEQQGARKIKVDSDS
jgi:HSP20 family protein